MQKVRIISGREVVTIVPLHRELSRGTLSGALELAQVDEQKFRDAAA